MKGKLAAIVITSIAIIGVITRLIWPDLKIDSITIGLLFIALIPWLPNYIKSAKLPGGWEVNFQNLEAAGKKIIKEDEIASENPESKYETVSYLSVADDDPSLGLVGLRIEIEKRLRKIAEISDIDTNRSLSFIVATLNSTGVFDTKTTSGLNELINAGNHAAHGALVDQNAATWAINQGPKVLATLDAKIQKLEGRNPVTGY
ncbi:MAG: hypothetical protein RPV21_18055 [Candidatus Sedimenticola sp. (ex Thyasira tokunagai)]